MSSDGSEYVKDIYNRGVQEIREELRNYWMNHSFLLGYQWTYWNYDQRSLDNVASEGDRIQATMNRMRANMRSIMANLTQRELSYENPPSAYDDATIRSARIGSALLQDIRKAHQWEVLREKHITALLKGGTAAISVDWDAENQTTVETVLPIGDFCLEPGSISDNRARYWIRKQALPTEEVYSMYAEYFPDGPPPVSSISSLDPYMHKIVGDNMGLGGTQVKRTFVYTYYERPNPLCPDGKILVEIDGRIVQNVKKWPFPFKDRLNISLGVETVVENRWYGATFLDDVRPVQVALNAAWSNLLEHLRDAGTARLTVPSSGVDYINQITDLPGEILEYPDGANKPEFLTPAQLTGWLRDMPDMLGEIIDDIMGVHDVTRGMAPANIESGLGLSILAEKDSSPVGRLIKETARVWGEVGQMVLQLHEQEVKKSRTTSILDGATQVRYDWKGSDIGGQTGCIIPLDAIIPRSRAAMQANADKMMQMGLITTVEQYTSVAELPGSEDILAAAAPDIAKARRENAGFVLGEVLLPQIFDDHALHIQTHNDFRKTQRYELLPVETQEIVDLHCQAHETLAAEQAGTAQEQFSVAPVLAASPQADGAMVDPAVLEAGMPEPEPMPEPAPSLEEELMDPIQDVNAMMAQLDQG
tara:strand:- start:35 stop:1972 length:1938 start_codon:yes stop_codon:yes gene_type:complete